MESAFLFVGEKQIPRCARDENVSCGGDYYPFLPSHCAKYFAFSPLFLSSINSCSFKIEGAGIPGNMNPPVGAFPGAKLRGVQQIESHV
jgi:hypothetical protein